MQTNTIEWYRIPDMPREWRRWNQNAIYNWVQSDKAHHVHLKPSAKNIAYTKRRTYSVCLWSGSV